MSNRHSFLLATAAFVTLIGGGGAGCRTTGPATDPDRSEVLSVSSDSEGGRESASGYFVSLSSSSKSPQAVALYDKLYDALDTFNRKKAREAGDLSGYVEEFDATGYTGLTVGDEEIECDREKCLIKLTGRVVTAGAADQQGSFAHQLLIAFDLSGIEPVTDGRGEGITKTFTLGDPERLEITCTQKGFGQNAIYACRFELDGAVATGATMNPAERGKLSSCTLSPGVVKSAEEATAELEGGALLKLTPSQGGGKPVGFLRYSKQGREVDLVDIFLCGDVSHDTFYLSGAGKEPRRWFTKEPHVGTAVTLDSAHQEDVEMRLTAQIVEETAESYTLEVKFLLAASGKSPNDVYGDDRFFVKLDKAWIRR